MEVGTIIGFIISVILLIILIVSIIVAIIYIVKYSKLKRQYDTDIATKNTIIQNKDSEITTLTTKNNELVSTADICKKKLSSCTTNKQKVVDDFGKCTADLTTCKQTCIATVVPPPTEPPAEPRNPTEPPAEPENPTEPPATASSQVTSQWSCIGNMTAPIRRNVNGDVECMASDSKNCARQTDMLACNKVAETPISPLNPLACGEMHKKIYGVTGYDTPGHWCNM